MALSALFETDCIHDLYRNFSVFSCSSSSLSSARYVFAANAVFKLIVIYAVA
jgi:hypothetical protein